MRSTRLLREAGERLVNGDWFTAADLSVRVLTTKPRHPEALHLAGIAAACRGDLDTAIAYLEQAVHIVPQSARWLNDLGVAYAGTRRWRDAANTFINSAALAARDSQPILHAADALLELRDHTGAIALCERALAVRPGSADALRSLGRCLAAAGRYRDALEPLRSSIQIEPGSARSHELISQVFQRLRQYDSAFWHARAAVRLAPDSARLRCLLGATAWDSGKLMSSLAAYRSAAQLEPNDPEIASARINVLLHHPNHTGAAILRHTQRWADRHGVARADSGSRPRDQSPFRTLRVGYLTGEFATVPAYFFLYPILSAHDRRKFHITCYHARAVSDAKTRAFRRVSDRWRDVHGRTDDDVVHLICRDKIDILVDCSGHYVYSRLPVFAQRPAPIQVVMPNCPATTGLPQMDYILTDRWTTPAGTESQYSECVWRLRTGYMVYEPPNPAPAITPLPAGRSGVVTFGVFQRPAKLNTAVWDAIAQILSCVPSSRLLLHNSSADLDDCGSQTRQTILRNLRRLGIAAERVIFRGNRRGLEHLQVMAEADIALDTYPYNGQTTTCECLWMGVPVVTLCGDSHVARVGHGILGRAGQGAWATRSVKEYVDFAVKAAHNVGRLERLRSGLRERVASSLLTDGPAVTRAIESAYRSMWSRWCNGQPPTPGRS